MPEFTMRSAICISLPSVFCGQKAAETQPFEPPYQILLQLYTHHSLKEHFEDYWRVLTKRQATQPLTQRTITEAYFLAEARVDFLTLYNTTDAAKEMHETDSKLHSMLLTNILRYSFTIEIIGKQISETFNNPFLEAALLYAAQHQKWVKKHPLLYVYYVLYLQIKALQNNTADKRWLTAWLRKVEENQDIFDVSELARFYAAAENIAALIINKKHPRQNSLRLAFRYLCGTAQTRFFSKIR